MKSDTEAQLACLLELNNVYSTPCLFLDLCNLQTLACALPLAFSVQAYEFTPSTQYIISSKLSFELTWQQTESGLYIAKCVFFQGDGRLMFAVSRQRAIPLSRYVCFALHFKVALLGTPHRGSP